MALDLKLDRDKMHTQFSSWRLQPFATVSRQQIKTTGHASGVESTALDFLHTRASVLRNHLLLSEGRLFVFTQTESNNGYYVYELLPVPGSDEGVLARQVAELGADAGEQPVGGAAEAVVDCSLAVVAGASGQTQQPVASSGLTADGAMPGAAAVAASQDGWQLLLSRGHGDVVLLRRRGDQLLYSNAVHPIRPRLPYTGVRPVILEAAVAQPNGDITAIAWAMRGKGPHTVACCEVFAITLRAQEVEEPPGNEAAEAATPGAAGAARLQLQTVGVRLLLRTKLPPHLVRVMPPAPASGPAMEAGAAEAAPAGTATGAEGAVVVLGFDPSTAGLEEDDDEEEAGAPRQGAAGCSGAATTAAAATDPDAMYDDGDDLDPRTLEQAAVRLAHMTSEQRAGPQPPAQWADIYKESGPDGVGAMGAEPAVDLAAWRLPEEGPGVGAAADRALAPFWRLSCGAHRLLSAEGPLRAQGQQPDTPREPQPLLLGLTDDVDCAVLSVERTVGASGAQRQEQQEQLEREHTQRGHGAGSASGVAAAAGGEAVELQARHALSIPALAYVAAGKTYKRHLLLSSSGTAVSESSGGSGGGVFETGSGARPALAAVLVESQRFMYLYGVTSVREEYGRQQVVELGLEDGETVLGARLLEVPGSEGEGAAAAEGSGSASRGMQRGRPVVVVATQRRLLSYRLRM